MSNQLKITLCLVIGLFVFTGCGNQAAKEIARMQVYAIRYPPQFKILANTLDPCFTGVAKSDTIIHRDTTTIKGDTLINTVLRHDTAFITKVITLPGKTITVLKKITDTVTNDRNTQAIEATAKISADSLNITKGQLTVYKAKADKFSLWFWLENGFLGLALLVFVGIKVYKLFSGGAITSAITNIKNKV
ncbi:MAG: hypothetical protein P4L31_07540 [Candidatus Babeliales bacterium]|nr:hypothetical protein [Candidatus Babeliales bacterium]